MKKITSYFHDSESAGCAAFELADSSATSGEIILSNKSTESSNAFDCCVLATFFGGSLGVIGGIILCQFAMFGFLSQISPLSGLITGSVIGAITGCILDFSHFQNHPWCSCLTVYVNHLNCAKILRYLKKQGAVGSFIIKSKNISS